MATLVRTAGTHQVTQPTTDHRAQEIRMLRVIAAGDALSVLEFFLDHGKLVLTHNGRDLDHDNPVFRRHALDTAIAASHRFEGRDASLRCPVVDSPGIHCTGIDGICQNMVDGAITPMQAAAWSAHSRVPSTLWPTHESRVSCLPKVKQTVLPPSPLR